MQRTGNGRQRTGDGGLWPPLDLSKNVTTEEKKSFDVQGEVFGRKEFDIL